MKIKQFLQKKKWEFFFNLNSLTHFLNVLKKQKKILMLKYQKFWVPFFVCAIALRSTNKTKNHILICVYIVYTTPHNS